MSQVGNFARFGWYGVVAFFEQGEAQVGIETTEFVGGGKADDSPTDDDHIRLFHEKNNVQTLGSS